MARRDARRSRERDRSLIRPYDGKVSEFATTSGGRLCGAVKADGSTCTLPAGYNTDHLGYGTCYGHFGRTPAGQEAAANEQASELMQFYGVPIDVTPGEVLMQEVRRTAGHVAFLGAEIAKWEYDPNNFKAGPNEDLLGWIKLYQAERTHLMKVAKAALDAGVQEREISLAENVGRQLADTIDRILMKLVLTDDQKRLIPLVVPHELRQLMSAREDEDDDAPY